MKTMTHGFAESNRRDRLENKEYNTKKVYVRRPFCPDRFFKPFIKIHHLESFNNHS